MGWVEWGKTYHRTSEANWKRVLRWNTKYPGEMVFCASMADVLDPDVPWQWRRDLWGLIHETPNLHWLLLTKRPEEWALLPAIMPGNVWFGVSIENQKHKDRLLGLLIAKDRLGANNTFVSYEPLIGPVQHVEDYYHANAADWIIIGGESGPGCRPMDLKWAEDLAYEAKEYEIPVFIKQLGGHPNKREDINEFPKHLQRQEIPILLASKYTFSREKGFSLPDTGSGKETDHPG
jgi:protein gp37